MEYKQFTGGDFVLNSFLHAPVKTFFKDSSLNWL
jgi:hypothetical protein